MTDKAFARLCDSTPKTHTRSLDRLFLDRIPRWRVALWLTRGWITVDVRRRPGARKRPPEIWIAPTDKGRRALAAAEFRETGESRHEEVA